MTRRLSLSWIRCYNRHIRRLQSLDCLFAGGSRHVDAEATIAMKPRGVSLTFRVSGFAFCEVMAAVDHSTIPGPIDRSCLIWQCQRSKSKFMSCTCTCGILLRGQHIREAAGGVCNLETLFRRGSNIERRYVAAMYSSSRIVDGRLL